NRPSETAFDAAMPGWAGLAADPPVVFIGGPVARENFVGLARARESGLDDDDEPRIAGPIGPFDPDKSAAAAELAYDGVRLFAGYSGWGPGQLESEIEAGAWFVVDVQADDLLCPEPDALWRSVLR